MTATDGVAQMGLSPPTTDAPQPAPSADDGDGSFAETIAVVLAAADGGEQNEDPAASEENDGMTAFAPPIEPPPPQEAPEVTAGEQDRPDRSAGAGTELAVTVAASNAQGLERALANGAGRPPVVAAANGNRPDERLGVLLRDVAPQDRSAAAEQWNRIGGRWAATAPPGDAAAGTDVPDGTPATNGNRPDASLAQLLRDIAPDQRATMASEWNRAGGRLAATTPSSDPPAGAGAPDGTPAATGNRPDASLGELLRNMASGDRAATASEWHRASQSTAGGPPGDTPAASLAGLERAAERAAEHGAQAAIGRLASNAARQAGANAAAPSDGDAATEPPLLVAAPPPLLAGEAAPAPASVEPVEAADGRALASRLAQTVREAVRTGEREFRLVLNPPELGQITVRVTDGDGGVHVLLRAASAEASELILRHLPLLQQGLEGRALSVDRLQVIETDAGTLVDDWLSETGDEPRGQRDGGDADVEQPAWSSVAASTDGGEEGDGPGPQQAAAGRLDVRA